jgi:hypothetical protein
MLQIIGWIVWGIVTFLAIALTRGWVRRSYSRQGKAYQMATWVQTFFLWVIVILFLVFEWNKLHLIWIAPILFFSAQVLVFLGMTLTGIKKSEGLRNYLETRIVSSGEIELIRNLAKTRVRNDPVTSVSGDVASILKGIKSFSEIELMGLPEATIVTIVKTYWQLKTEGLSDKKIFEAIENHRARFDDDTGILPSQSTLSNYIKYRVRLEHHGDSIIRENLIDISDDFIDEAIKETRRTLQISKVWGWDS